MTSEFCGIFLDIQAKYMTLRVLEVPDQIGTLAQVGTSPNLGWPNKELRGSPPG